MLVARAFDGLALHVGSSTVALGGVEAKLRVETMEVLVHGVARLPEQPVRLGVTTAPGSEPVTLRVLPGTRAPIAPSRGKPLPGGGFKAELTESDGVWWRL